LKQRGGHTCSRYFTDEGQVSEVLFHALRDPVIRVCPHVLDPRDPRDPRPPVKPAFEIRVAMAELARVADRSDRRSLSL
jgi:hypothetical protein